jgi:hypothetical protein
MEESYEISLRDDETKTFGDRMVETNDRFATIECVELASSAIQNFLPMKALLSNWRVCVLLLAVAIEAAFLLGMPQWLYHEAMTHGETASASEPLKPKMWTRAQLLQKLQAALQSQRSNAMSSFMGRAEGSVDQRDLGFLLEKLVNLPGSPFLDRRMLLQLNKTDPSQAFALAQQVSDPRQRYAMVWYVLGATIQNDPKQAITELAQLPEGPGRQTMYLEIFIGWTSSSPENAPKAATAALALPAGPDRDFALSGVIEVWRAREPQAEQDWAGGLGPDDATVLESAAALVAVRRNHRNAAA